MWIALIWEKLYPIFYVRWCRDNQFPSNANLVSYTDGMMGRLSPLSRSVEAGTRTAVKSSPTGPQHDQWCPASHGLAVRACCQRCLTSADLPTSTRNVLTEERGKIVDSIFKNTRSIKGNEALLRTKASFCGPGPSMVRDVKICSYLYKPYDDPNLAFTRLLDHHR